MVPMYVNTFHISPFRRVEIVSFTSLDTNVGINECRIEHQIEQSFCSSGVRTLGKNQCFGHCEVFLHYAICHSFFKLRFCNIVGIDQQIRSNLRNYTFSTRYISHCVQNGENLHLSVRSSFVVQMLTNGFGKLVRAGSASGAAANICILLQHEVGIRF